MKNNSEFLLNLGQKVQETRISKGMTQNELCEKAEIARSQLTRLEQGDLNITMNTLKSLADALQVSAKELLDF